MGVEEIQAEIKTRLEALIAPIEGGVGADASFDDSFEAVKREIDKVNSLEGGTTDWNAVRNGSEDILSNKSKDFRVALYYWVASALTGATKGALDGLVVLNELCNAYWEPMYPPLKRPRARGNLCSWANDLLAPVVQGWTPTAKDKDFATTMSRTFRELDGTLADKLGDAYPGMLSLRNEIENALRRVPAEAAPPPPPPPPPAPKIQAAPVSTSTPTQTDEASSAGEVQQEAYYGGSGGVEGGLAVTPISDPGTAAQALAEISPTIGSASAAILAADPTSADGYWLARVAAWLTFQGTPPNDGGRLYFDGPYEHVSQSLTDLAAAQDWNGLLATASQIASEHPLYLDATRAIATALENLGGDYEKAKNAVLRETAALLGRAPELPTLMFANGVPTANDETKTWVGGLGSGGGGGAKTPVDKAIAEAAKLVAAEQAPQAIGLLSRAAATVTSPAQKFKARLEIAKVALRGQFLDIARAQLEALERLAEAHRLSDWDPDICAEMYANLYRARRFQMGMAPDDQELTRKSAEAFQRLCELDAAQALKVMQEAAG
ncbi:MAG: type VI secretion system protein TssA [Polyangiaceae bacterium]